MLGRWAGRELWGREHVVVREEEYYLRIFEGKKVDVQLAREQHTQVFSVHLSKEDVEQTTHTR